MDIHMDAHTITLVIGFVGGILYIASHYMKTMVPLRVCEIASNALFVVYGALYPSWPTLALYGILVPLNSLRLYEMLELIKKVRTASQGDLSMDWLKPFMHKRAHKKGEILFSKGDHAEEMFYILSGSCRIRELNLTVSAGRMLGELGFLSPDNRRTGTVECLEDVELGTITYDKVRELYFQNPTFGFYLLRLSSERLLQNVARMERELEVHSQPAPA
jgi:CRP/FNR family cyclic AMP-dependent transcriptional regulator